MSQHAQPSGQPASSVTTSASPLPSPESLPALNGHVPPATAATPHQLRYHNELSKYLGCPPPNGEQQPFGYRFCFSDVEDRRNFLPNAILDLSRTDGRAPLPCCSSYALSMFSSLESLSAKRALLSKRIKKFAEKKGGCYVLLQLGAGSGRCACVDESGHFDFFEYLTFNAVKSVVEHAEIKA